MFRFVTDGPDSPSSKRKQSQRACHQCKKRKKRCVHFDEAERTERPTPGTRRRSSRMQRSGRRNTDATTAYAEEGCNRGDYERVRSAGSGSPGMRDAPANTTVVSCNAVEEQPDSRFVGDLNPEGIICSMTSQDTVSDSSCGGIGVWLFRKMTEDTSNETLGPLLRQPQSAIDSGKLSSKVLWRARDERCLHVLPAPADTQALISIYSEEIHPIFPVVDLDTYFSMQDDSTSKAILTQAICLAATSNKRAERFLALQPECPPVSSGTFVEQLSSAIRLSLDLRLVADKFTLIQVLTMLSLFSQLSADDHSSADLLSQAVSYAHTLGLHLQPRSDTPHNSRERELFCCLWALDRLNAAFHGRPVMMHERDIGRDLEGCFEQQTGPFKLLLRIVLLLDRIIDLYRPSSSAAAVSGWESGFPAFEDLLYSSCSSQTCPHLLATAEVLYQAVAMLSCRSQSLEEPARSSASYVRQSLSADKVVWIVGEEFRDQLSKFPIVPYAVCLALRFYYRELRLSKAPYFRSRARQNLLRTCSILRPFGGFYSSATAMAQMVEDTIREMDKVCSSMASNTPHHESGGRATTNANASYNAQSGPDTTFPDNSAAPRGCNVTEQPLSSEGDLLTQRDGTAHQPLGPAGAGSLEQSLFDDMAGDIDIFEYFDPGFDLNAIDTAIGWSSNAAFPTFPTND